MSERGGANMDAVRRLRDACRARGLLWVRRMTPFRLRTQHTEIALGLGDIRIGRAPTCEIALDDPCLSREHASLHVAPARITLRDLGSRNGTWLNDLPVDREVEVLPGDRIELGSTHAQLVRLAISDELDTTASFRTCPGCGGAYVVKASGCPRCGRVSQPVPRKTDSQRRFDFWLQLEAELLEKALSMQRIEEAEASLHRMRDKLEALATPPDPRHLDVALCAAIRLGRMVGDAEPIAWALSMVQRHDGVPSADLFALVAATPLPLLSSEAPYRALETLVAQGRRRADLTTSEQSCLQSLDQLSQDLAEVRRAWGEPPPHRPQPWGETLRPPG